MAYDDLMKIHFIQGMGFSGNMFLIDAEKPALIDAGWDSDVSYPAQSVERILEKRKLAYIVLTHRHIDHVGGTKGFQERFGGEILAHELDADALITGDPISTGARLFGGDISPMEVRKLAEGERIELGGADHLEVIHTPGHTVGSMCLLAPDKSLFSGDTVFSHGSVGRWDLETGNYRELLESVERLADMDIENLYPGHESSVEGGAGEHLAMSLKYLKSVGSYG